MLLHNNCHPELLCTSKIVTCTEKLCEVSNRLVVLTFKSRHQSRQTIRILASGITNFKITHLRNDHEIFECLHILTFLNKILIYEPLFP